jgi:hypothetical protein
MERGGSISEGLNRGLRGSERVLKSLENCNIVGITVFGVYFRFHQKIGKDFRIKQINIVQAAGRVQLRQVPHCRRPKRRIGGNGGSFGSRVGRNIG